MVFYARCAAKTPVLWAATAFHFARSAVGWWIWGAGWTGVTHLHGHWTHLQMTRSIRFWPPPDAVLRRPLGTIERA